MLHQITARTEALVKDLGALGRDIEGQLLAVATPDARSEWREFRRQWPSRAQLSAGRLPLSEDELAHMVVKVQRFKSILLEAFEAEDAFAAVEVRPLRAVA
jgi:hypothetical protein